MTFLQNSPCTKGDVQIILKHMLRASASGAGLEQGHTRGIRSHGKKARSLIPTHHSRENLTLKVCFQSTVLDQTLILMCGQEEVRKFAMTLLKRVSKKSPIPTPSSDCLTRFEKRRIGGPTPADFRVQLSGSLACQWNDRAAHVFSKEYIQKRGRQFKRKDLADCFKVHLRTLKNQYRRINSTPTKTQMEIEACSTSARRMRKQGVSMTRRHHDVKELSSVLTYVV
jgi:hypothetical protein